jgi:parallel beta-helix repeat protein
MKVTGPRMRWLLLFLLTSATVLAPMAAPTAAAATVRRVPQDSPTIQAAIDAAVAGDTVQVSPGTYVERIDFLGKEITVQSTGGPATTIIDGDQAGGVVRMVAGDGQTPVLRGFTIRNGNEPFDGGGIFTSGGPALIEGNRVTGNIGCDGAGIAAAFSSATIRGNLVADNRPNCSGGTGGGGINLRGDGTVQVLGNEVRGNVTAADGGGISLFAAGTPTISGNTISGNAAEPGRDGGGISLVNSSNALISNNFIVGNSGAEGGGIFWLVPFGDPGPNVVNNTIAGNSASTNGSAVFADGFDGATRLTNNVLVGAGPEAVLACGDFNDLNPPVIAFNNVFNAGAGPEYGGTCTDQTGQDGNISADPRFVDAGAGNFHVQAGSPVVDAGRNQDAPATDVDGDPRPLDGNGDGVAVVDIGADEVAGGDTTPPTITCTAIPATLWPPDHTLRTVRVAISAADDAGPVTVALVSVTSNQADRGLGRGDLPGDIRGWTAGGDDRRGQLRAERFGSTRVYTLTYRAKDAAGNTARCRTTVTVPRWR